MKVLFLDFDGVLNNCEWMKKINWQDRPISMFEKDKREIDPTRVKMISDLALEFNASIVISSSWRILLSLEELKALLYGSGLDQRIQVIGVTPQDSRGFRGSEVETWLKNTHHTIESHVIFDDDGDFHKDQPLVQTSWDSGLQEAHIDLARGFLIT
jgi:hypothetical protein